MAISEDKTYSNLTNLYKTFVKNGYDMEPEDEFRENIKDAKKRRAAYDALVNDGYDMEPFEEFENNIGMGAAALKAERESNVHRADDVRLDGTMVKGQQPDAPSVAPAANGAATGVSGTVSGAAKGLAIGAQIGAQVGAAGAQAPATAQPQQQAKPVQQQKPQAPKAQPKPKQQAPAKPKAVKAVTLRLGGKNMPIPVSDIQKEGIAGYMNSRGWKATQLQVRMVDPQGKAWYVRADQVTNRMGKGYKIDYSMQTPQWTGEQRKRAERQMEGNKQTNAALQQRWKDESTATKKQTENALKASSVLGQASKGEMKVNPETGKIEQSYITPQGYEVFDKIQADVMAHQWREDTAYERGMNAALRDVWGEADEENKAARKEADEYASSGSTIGKDNIGGVVGDVVDAIIDFFGKGGEAAMETEDNQLNGRKLAAEYDYQLTKHDIYNLENLAQKMVDRLPGSVRDRRRKQLMDAYKKENSALSQRELEELANNAMLSDAYQNLSEKAQQVNAPKSVTEFLIRKITDHPLLSQARGIETAAAWQKGSHDMEIAETRAIDEYGKQHKVANIVGTVGNVATSPEMYVGGAIGSLAAKSAMGTIGLATRVFLPKVAVETTERYLASTLVGRIINGAVAGAYNFATYNALSDIESQARMGGVLDPITGKPIGWSWDQTLGATEDGFILGATTGVLSPVLGNVTDKAVKATTSTMGKAGVRVAGAATSTMAEGTVFALHEAHKNGEPLTFDIWSDNVATMIGFKAQHGIKSVGKVLGELKGDGKRYGLSFEERVRKQLDASPADAGFTKEELDELRRAGYDSLARLFSKSGVTTQHKTAPRETIRTTENGAVLFDKPAENAEKDVVFQGTEGYDELGRLMADPNVSEAARARAYYIVTGRALPMSTVVGYERIVHTDANGKQTIEIKSVGAEGQTITTRSFANEKQAQAEMDKVMRQAELNTVDAGEKWCSNKVADEVARAAVEEVVPGADYNTVMSYYKAVRDGKLTDPAWVERADAIDKAVERRSAESTDGLPDAIRERLNKESGLDIDATLRKEPSKRTEQEQALVQRYIDELVPRAEREAHEQEQAEYREKIAARQEIVDEGETKSDELRTQVENRTHKETGMIQPATMKVNDRQVYVISGDVVMFPDRSGVDASKSSDTIVIVDAETGVKRFASPNEILTMAEPIDPQAELSTAQGTIDAETNSKLAEGGFQPRAQQPNAEAMQAATVLELQQQGIAWLYADQTPEQMEAQARQQLETGVDATIRYNNGELTDADYLSAIGVSVDGMEAVELAEQAQREAAKFAPYITDVAPEGPAAPAAPRTKAANTEAIQAATIEQTQEAGITSLNESYVEEHPEQAQAEAIQALEQGVEATIAHSNGEISDADYLAALGYATGEGTWLDVANEQELAEQAQREAAKFAPYINDVEPEATEEPAAPAATPEPKTPTVAEDEQVPLPSQEGLRNAFNADVNAQLGANAAGADLQQGVGRVKEGMGAQIGAERFGRQARAAHDAQLQELADQQRAAHQPDGEELYSAMSRIPRDGEGKPMFEVARAEDAWDGIVEYLDDANDAAAYVDGRVKSSEKKVTDAESALKKVKVSDDIDKFREDRARAREALADAQSQLERWKGIAAVRVERAKAAEAQRRAEMEEKDRIEREKAREALAEQKRLEAEKAAEQERLGANKVNPKIVEKWTKANKVDGAKDVITLPDGSQLKGHYVLAEAGTATASHNASDGYKPTEGFPVDENGQNVNDRDYQRDTEAQGIVQSMADSYDSRALQDPVVVSQHGVVMSGNNRTMSGDIAAKQGTDTAYTEYLGEYGGKYGFTPDQVKGMEHPRVYFVPDEVLPYDAATFARFNGQEKKSQNKAEQAVKLGKTVPDNVFNNVVRTLAGYDKLGDFYADNKATVEALKAIGATMPDFDKRLPELMTGNALSAQGRELLENMLIGKIFQADPDAVRRIIDTPSLKRAILTGMNEIAHNRTLRGGYDLTNELARAIDLVARARANDPENYGDGKMVSPFGRQLGLFAEELGDQSVTDATVLLLADTLNSADYGDLRKVLASYNAEATDAAAGQLDVFSGEAKTKEQILTDVLNHFRNASKQEKRDMARAAIDKRKRASEGGEPAEQNGRGGAPEQAAPAAAGSGEGKEVEDGPKGEEPPTVETAGTGHTELDNDPELEARVTVTENESEEQGENGVVHKRDIVVDGKHHVTQVDEPDKKGYYNGSHYEYDGKRFGDLREAVYYIDKQGEGPAPVQEGVSPVERAKALAEQIDDLEMEDATETSTAKYRELREELSKILEGMTDEEFDAFLEYAGAKDWFDETVDLWRDEKNYRDVKRSETSRRYLKLNAEFGKLAAEGKPTDDPRMKQVLDEMRDVISHLTDEELNALHLFDDNDYSINSEVERRKTQAHMNAMARQMQAEQGELPIAAYKPKKFNIFSYTTSRPKEPWQGTVWHDNGHAVVSDGHFLIADKGSYDKKQDGKMVNKKGQVVEGKYLKWQALIEDRADEKNVEGAVSTIAQRLGAIEQRLRAAHEKATAKSKESPSIYGKPKSFADFSRVAPVILIMPDGNAVTIAYPDLVRMVDSALHMGQTDLRFVDWKRVITTKNEQGTTLTMPIVINEYDMQHDDYRETVSVIDLSNNKLEKVEVTPTVKTAGTGHTETDPTINPATGKAYTLDELGKMMDSKDKDAIAKVDAAWSAVMKEARKKADAEARKASGIDQMRDMVEAYRSGDEKAIADAEAQIEQLLDSTDKTVLENTAKKLAENVKTLAEGSPERKAMEAVQRMLDERLKEPEKTPRDYLDEIVGDSPVEIMDDTVTDGEGTAEGRLSLNGEPTDLYVFTYEGGMDDHAQGVQYRTDGITYEQSAQLASEFNEYYGQDVARDDADAVGVFFNNVDDALKFNEWNKQREAALKAKQEQEKMLNAWKEFKSKHPGTVLLFRVGDKYYAYNEDSQTCADILKIDSHDATGGFEKVSSFPHEDLDKHLPALIKAGKQVGMVDPIEGASAPSVVEPMKPIERGEGVGILDFAKEVADEVEKKDKEVKQAVEESKRRRGRKIDDYGEVIDGARKNALKEMAKGIDNITVETLITQPYSKVWKKPNLAKMVKDRAITEEEARYLEILSQWFLQQKKPAAKKGKGWSQRRREQEIRAWAESVAAKMQVYKAFIEADEATRQAMIEKTKTLSFPNREAELARVEEWKGLNRAHTSEERMASWGTCLTPDPLYVQARILEKMGYTAGDKVSLPPYSVVPTNFFTGYDVVDSSGKSVYNIPTVRDVDEAIDYIVTIHKLHQGYGDASIPQNMMYAQAISTKRVPSGYWRAVVTTPRGGVREQTFENKQQCDEYTAEQEKKGNKVTAFELTQTAGDKYSVAYKDTDGTRYTLGEAKRGENGEMEYSGEVFDSADEARAAIAERATEFSDGLVAKYNEAHAAELKGEKRPAYYLTNSWSKAKGRFYYTYTMNVGKDRVEDVAPSFNTKDEAEAWLKEHKTELDEYVKARKAELAKLKGNYLDAKGREGKDYRNGKDVTAEEFGITFGFRGVQFGNWTNDKDRQAALNSAYDSLMDMANIIGVSPRAISLNGELGIAFGARGSGSANAHYELNQVVINLTKTRGMGSLAHEWWHALDNYFARMGGMPMGMMTTATQREIIMRNGVVREEMGEVYRALVEAVQQNSYGQRQQQNGAYWRDPIEMTARLFDGWIGKRLAEQGEHSPFLTHVYRPDMDEAYRKGTYLIEKQRCELAGKEVVPYEEWVKMPESLGSYEVATAEELAELGQHLENFFNTMQEKEGENGNRILYHMGEDTGHGGVVRQQATEIMLHFLDKTGLPWSTDVEEMQRIMEKESRAQMQIVQDEPMSEEEKTVASNAIDKRMQEVQQQERDINLQNPTTETVTSITPSTEIDATSPEKTGGPSADISSAKVQRKILRAKDLAEKVVPFVELVGNGDIKVEDFAKEFKRHLGFRESGQKSEYVFLESDDNSTFTLRISDHSGNARNIILSGTRTDRGYSIVLNVEDSNNTKFKATTWADVNEYVYDNPDTSRLVAIAKSLFNLLDKGEYIDLATANAHYVSPKEKPGTQTLRTKDGDVFGFVKDGKIYLDPSKLNPNTPLHEYTHVWDTAVQKHNPELWKRGVELMKQTPLWEQVKNDPRYANIAHDDNLVASEVHSRLTGAEGEKVIEDMIREAAQGEERVLDKAEKISVIQRLKDWLNEVWKWLKDTMTPWTAEEASKVSLDDFIHMTLRDFVNGKKIAEDGELVPEHKDAQLAVINDSNPMQDSYHTGIRKASDIKTYSEVMDGVRSGRYGGGDALAYPDMSMEMLEEAERTGYITVYSSKPIEQGVFVTPSRLNARDYAGGGKIYSQRVKTSDVAWINEEEGQYAKVETPMQMDARDSGKTQPLKTDAVQGMEPETKERVSFTSARTSSETKQINVDGEAVEVVFYTNVNEFTIDGKHRCREYEIHDQIFGESRGWFEIDGQSYSYFGGYDELLYGIDNRSLQQHAFGNTTQEMADRCMSEIEKGIKTIGLSMIRGIYSELRDDLTPVLSDRTKPATAETMRDVQVVEPSKDETSKTTSSTTSTRSQAPTHNQAPQEEKKARSQVANKRADTTFEDWKKAKEEHPNAIVLRHVGDFYEAYDDDAKALSQGGATLTKRDGQTYQYLAGFPYYAVKEYGPKLESLGYQVMTLEPDGVHDVKEAVNEPSSLMFRDGWGVLDDEEVVSESDWRGKVYGTEDMTAADIRRRAEKHRGRMVREANRLAKRYGVDVEVVTEPREDVTDRGNYDPETGKLTVYIPNHMSPEDVQATFLHEIVGRKGLRDLFGQSYDQFIDNVWEHGNAEVREAIYYIENVEGLDRRAATEKLLRRLAEHVDMDAYKSWRNIKSQFLDKMDTLGSEYTGPAIGGNELQHVLRLSRSKAEDPRFDGASLEAREASAPSAEAEVEQPKPSTEREVPQAAEAAEVPSVYKERPAGYNHLKERHPDATLVFRTGAYLSLYDKDAQAAAKLLGRDVTKGKGGVVSLSVPRSELDNLLVNLVRNGHRVALCDPMPGTAESKTQYGLMTEVGAKDLDALHPEEANIDNLQYRVIDNPELLSFLDGQPTRKGFRYTQWKNQGVLPPMTAKVDGKWRDPMVFHKWEQSEEGMVKADGKADLNQGNGRTTGGVNYNPYFHIRVSPLNDQFTAAYDRPELLVVEGEYPESELTSGYRAEGAHDTVGLMDWHSGSVNGQLSDDTKVQTMLSRYFKPGRIVPWSEVADNIMERVGEQDVTFPINAVPPMLRAELAKRGAKFGPISGNVAPEDIPMLNDLLKRVNAGEWDAGLEEARAYQDAYENSDMAKADRVADLSNKFHTPVRVISDPAEVAALPTRRQRKSKGWIDTTTGEVVVVLPNNVNVADAENTVVHELLGHKGLRGMIGEARFGEFLDEVYGHATGSIKRPIDEATQRMVDREAERAMGNGASQEQAREQAEQKRDQYRRTATEEYMSDEAMRIGVDGFEKMEAEELTFWGKVKATIQKFLDRFLQGLGLNKFELTDKGLSYILYKSYKYMKYGEKPSIMDRAEDVALREQSGYDKTPEQLFRDGEPSLEATIAETKLQEWAQNKDNVEARDAAVAAVNTTLAGIRKAMSAQKKYDISTVKQLADLSQALVKSGMITNATPTEIERIIGTIKRGVGRDDLSGEVDKLMDIMVDNQLHNAQELLARQLSTRGTKVNASGIQIKGELDPQGDATLRAVREYMGMKDAVYSVDDLNQIIADASSDMSDPSKSKLEQDAAAVRYAAATIAREYVDSVRGSKTDESQLKAAVEQAQLRMRGQLENMCDALGIPVTRTRSDGKTVRRSPRELLAAIRDAGGDYDKANRLVMSYQEAAKAAKEEAWLNRIARVEALRGVAQSLGSMLGKSSERAKAWAEQEKERAKAWAEQEKERAKAWAEQEKERVGKIHHLANSDMQGRELQGQQEPSMIAKALNSPIVQLAVAPLADFHQMIRMFGSKNPNGEGYLYNHFMRGWVDAADGEQLWKEKYHKQMDDKAAELLGKGKKYMDLYKYADAGQKMIVSYFDGTQEREFELTQAQLMYLYAVEKMPMGSATNRNMGITEQDMERIADIIDPRLREFVDWVQEEMLPGMGIEVDQVHQRMFGAHMDDIENYFPFVRDKDALKKEVENGQQSQGNDKMSTKTGAIIKRQPSVAVWDIPNINFMDVLAKHVTEMSHWANFAELNRDLGTLLSYNHFKQQVFGIKSSLGSGKTLWNNFTKACAIVTDSYEPKRSDHDRAVVTIAKGVAMSKISLRPYTAMKQALSLPAFAGEVNPMYFVGDLGTVGVKAVQWTWKNLPNYRKRIQSRTIGDYRLRETEYDTKIMKAASWGMLPNIGMDALTIAFGAHGVYLTRKAKYIKVWGMDEAEADRRAKQDATICFNKSQQSSEGPFMAPIQVDHTVFASTAMLFRNASKLYSAEYLASMRNLQRIATGKVSKEYLAKQYLRTMDPEHEGEWTDEQKAKAEDVAKKEVRGAAVKNTVNAAMFGWILPWLWRLGASIPLFLLSTDDDKKRKTFNEALQYSAFGPAEGLLYGDVTTQGVNVLIDKYAFDSDVKLADVGRSNPIVSDLIQSWGDIDRDEIKAANEFINLFVSAGLGFNPQTITDWVVATMDAFDDRETQREFALWATRMLNVPKSQTDKIYLDELDLTVDGASKLTPREIAQRYAEYKRHQKTPLTGWMYSEQEKAEVDDKTLKNMRIGDTQGFDKAAKEKLDAKLGGSGTLNAEYDALNGEDQQIKDLKNTDEREWKKRREEFTRKGKRDRLKALQDYRKEMKRLTEIWLTTKDVTERDQAVRDMQELKSATEKKLGL